MTRYMALALLLAAIGTGLASAQDKKPLALHPDNPHYFLFRGKPTIIVTSAEHYGAVVNREFDYVKYLDELQAHGLNNTRTFTGAYVEPQGAFNIAKNTLAPAADKFICPWPRSGESGNAHGGNKFDLTKWDEEYFKRLKDFVAQTSARGVIVEMNLFCPFYEEMQWKISPLNATNNVNGVGKVARTDVYTLDKHGGLLAVQEKMTERIVRELNAFDNLYYEICNEPYFGGVTLAWQDHIAEKIAAVEKDLPNQHLISRNVANGSAKIDKPHPAISLYNFHYATPPKAVAENFALNKPIGDNETGFKGTADAHYRMEAWQFLLAGGAVYNNLDYSFTVGHEDGTFAYPDKQPGGGNRGFRQQMKILKDFLEGFDFIKMQPATDIVAGPLPAKTTAYVLAEPGKQYAIYLHGQGTPELSLKLPAGAYEATWLHPVTGKTTKLPAIKHDGMSPLKLVSPKLEPDVALGVRRVELSEWTTSDDKALSIRISIAKDDGKEDKPIELVVEVRNDTENPRPAIIPHREHLRKVVLTKCIGSAGSGIK